jgi:hypothetical protein
VSTFEWNAGQERRLAPRVNILVAMKGELVTLDEPATVLQLSTRGMTVQTTIPLSPNGVHEFRLHLENRLLDVKTRAVHSRWSVKGDEVSYISGLAFVDLTPEAEATLEALVQSLEQSVVVGEGSGSSSAP